MMRLKLVSILLYLAVCANATALINDVIEEDDSIEDTDNPQKFYDTRLHPDDSWFGRKEEKPTISDNAILLPHESYCQYFYVFDGRDTYIFMCASGYRFDAEQLQCLQTKSVNCGKRKKNTNSSEEKKIRINYKCPKWSGIHPHEHYCHLFYSCENKKPSLFMCPPGKLFDKSANKCVYREYVNCGKSVDPYEGDDFENDAKPDKDSHVVFECPDSAGDYADHEYCNKFIKCWYGIGETYVCPKGKLFDEDLKRCRSRNSVYCNYRKDPYDDVEDPILIDPYSYYKCKTISGRYPHKDCNKFYQCQNGEARFYACPLWTMFDIPTQSCKPASEVNCDGGEVDNNDDEFVCPAREGSFKDDENCDSYYKCKHGKAQHLQCPQGELFDTDRKTCDDANIVTCGDRLFPGEEPEEEESVIDENPDYRCQTRHGLFRHEEICNYYYHCKEGQPSVRSCKKGKYFDTNRRSCSDNVDCGYRRPKEDEITTPKPPEFSCLEQSGKFIHPRDCGAYYLCEKYKHKIHHCPKGKLFHDKYLSCVNEESVTCGHRIHPDSKGFPVS